MSSANEARPADAQWGYEFGCDGVLSATEASDLLRVTRETLSDYAKQGHIRKSRPGGRYVWFCRRSIMEFIARSEVGAD